MEEFKGLKVNKLTEGKTKIIYELVDRPSHVLIHSKDRITAGDGARSNELQGKASISNSTCSGIFALLKEAGMKSHFVEKLDETSFIAKKCHMIPIEFVMRRVATGSFLKRNPGVPEGHKFYPVKLEYFYKDDANHDPQWSGEQIVTAGIDCAGVVIKQYELDIIGKMATCIFEILEKAWSLLNCSLIDMKIEFGVDCETKELLLADIIDSDSWRLWPSGDRRLMKDKQVYRDLAEVTPEALEIVKKNFAWIDERVKEMNKMSASGKVVVLMGSKADLKLGEEVKKHVSRFGIPCDIRVTSAHKGPDMTLKVISEYEGKLEPVVFVAIAGRSNGLGPTVSGNTMFPVINCPPITPEWGAQDIWSSLRLPSGLSCSTVLSSENAALSAAHMLALNNFQVWSKLKVHQLNNWLTLLKCDHELQ